MTHYYIQLLENQASIELYPWTQFNEWQRTFRDNVKEITLEIVVEIFMENAGVNERNSKKEVVKKL